MWLVQCPALSPKMAEVGLVLAVTRKFCCAPVVSWFCDVSSCSEPEGGVSRSIRTLSGTCLAWAAVVGARMPWLVATKIEAWPGFEEHRTAAEELHREDICGGSRQEERTDGTNIAKYLWGSRCRGGDGE